MTAVLDMVGPEEIKAWRLTWAADISSPVPELRRAAFQKLVICDLALDGIKYRQQEPSRSEATRDGKALELLKLAHGTCDLMYTWADVNGMYTGDPAIDDRWFADIVGEFLKDCSTSERSGDTRDA